MKKDEKKPAYILCPRCELNYIKAKDKYCTVCKAEMGLVDRSVLLPDDDEAGEKLCPICQVNYLGEDEEICFLCQKERDEKRAAEEKEKEEWEGVRSQEEDQTPIGILTLEEDSLLSTDEEPEEEEDEMVRTEGDEDFDFPEVNEADFEGDEDDDLDDEDDEDDDFGDF